MPHQSKREEKAKCAACGKKLEITVEDQLKCNAVGGRCFDCVGKDGSCPSPSPEARKWECDWNEKFYEGESNSVCCRKHKIFATPVEIKRFIAQTIAREVEAERERIAREIRGLIKLSKTDWPALEDLLTFLTNSHDQSKS